MALLESSHNDLTTAHIRRSAVSYDRYQSLRDHCNDTLRDPVAEAVVEIDQILAFNKLV